MDGIVETLHTVFDPAWLMGPMLDKELRVASRQRKSYLVRFAYVSLLTALVAGTWFSLAPASNPGSAVYQASRMGTVGRYLAVTVVWFQFIAAQILAVALLSRAIQREIHKRTLPVLAVTPIRGIQIVGGKLAGALLPIAMLLAASLPLLAIVRVFGGVSWDYVLSGVCLTFTATVFLGALCLVPSAPYGAGFVGFLQTLWYVILLRGLDALLAWLGQFFPAFGAAGLKVMQLINPTDVLLARTQAMLAARPSLGLSAWWPVHCLILLGGSALILAWLAGRVRTLAAISGPIRARQGTMHRLGAWVGRRGIRATESPGRRPPRATPIRRVQGSPIVWKELRKYPQWGSRLFFVRYGARTVGALMWIAVVVGLVIIEEGSFRLSVVLPMLAPLVLSLHGGLIVGLAVMAAGAITREREARTLPILLTIPWDDREIVRDEAIAVLRRGLFFFVPLSALSLVLLIVMMEFMSRAAALTLLRGVGLYLVSLLGIAPFLVGLGLYGSVRLKTAAGASVCMFVLFFGLILGGWVAFVPALRRGSLGAPPTWQTVSFLTAFAALALAGVGLVLLRAASRRLRCNIF
jgi:ABC-type transport system involved in multi-copper enzyme maturation permease subunit